jgi:hypothetical protein
LGGRCCAFRMLPLLRINSFTTVESSFCSRAASAVCLGEASGSRAARMGRSYLQAECGMQ